MRRLSTSIILLLLCALVVMAPVLFTRTTWFLRDLAYIFHPWKSLCAEMIQRGEMPLWNPYAYGGMPLLANWQSAVFYPFSLLFYFFPFASALKAYHLVHIFLAGFFAMLFGRRSGMTAAGALAAGVLFAINGYMITRLEFLSHIGTDIWLFALLLFLRHPVLLAFAGATAFFAGHQVIALIGVILAAYAFARPDRGRCLVSLASAAALALLLTACQFIPTAELALHSARVTRGIDSATAMLYSALPLDLRRLTVPLFKASAAAVMGEKLPWTATFHIGLTGVLLALAACFIRGNRRILLFCSALIAAGTLLALGNATPVYPWLYNHCPGFTAMRYPVQFMLLTTAGLTILAGSGLRGRWAFAAVPVIAAELLFYAWDFQPRAPDGFYTAPIPAAAFLQNRSDGGRFLLSPGTEKQRHFSGPSVDAVWQTARSYLYGLVCLPYHVPNAYGTGEPLVPAQVEQAVSLTYRQKSPAAVLPYLKDLEVRYLLCRNPLPPTAGFTLVSSPAPHIYRVDQNKGETAQPLAFIRQQEYNDNPGFYRPPAFRAGVLVSLAAVLCLAAYGIIKLRRMPVVPGR